MTTTQKFLAELEQESVNTQKMFAAVPTDKLGWKPHPKSMSMRDLVTHIGEIPGWIKITVETDGLDVQTNEPRVEITDQESLQAYFRKELANGREALQHATDKGLEATWTMSYGDRVISVRPKEDVIRMCLSQIIHHRAQLGVYLRLLDVPIPGSYGPSADEKGM